MIKWSNVLLKLGTIFGVGIIFKKLYSFYLKEIELDGKNHKIIETYYQWVNIKNRGRKIEEYLILHEYNSAAIYGGGHLGESLYYELKNSRIELNCIIDQNIDNVKFGREIKIITPNDIIPDVDVIIVTPIFYVDNIAAMLDSKVNCPILSLQDIICELIYD